MVRSLVWYVSWYCWRATSDTVVGRVPHHMLSCSLGNQHKTLVGDIGDTRWYNVWVKTFCQWLSLCFVPIWSNYLWYFWVVVLVWLGACLTGKRTNSSLNMSVLEGSSLLEVDSTKESIGTYFRKWLFQKWLCRCVQGYTLFVLFFEY